MQTSRQSAAADGSDRCGVSCCKAEAEVELTHAVMRELNMMDKMRLTVRVKMAMYPKKFGPMSAGSGLGMGWCL
jgi:hypothetical protein